MLVRVMSMLVVRVFNTHGARCRCSLRAKPMIVARDVYARLGVHDGTRIGKFKTFRTCNAKICCNDDQIGSDDRANASDAQANNVRPQICDNNAFDHSGGCERIRNGQLFSRRVVNADVIVLSPARRQCAAILSARCRCSTAQLQRSWRATSMLVARDAHPRLLELDGAPMEKFKTFSLATRKFAATIINRLRRLCKRKRCLSRKSTANPR